MAASVTSIPTETLFATLTVFTLFSRTETLESVIESVYTTTSTVEGLLGDIAIETQVIDGLV